MDYLRRKGSFKSMRTNDDDIEAATTSTQMGGIEEETYQLREILNEKDKVIDLLTKEKNYYIKRCEQQNKTTQNEIDNARVKVHEQA